MTGTNAEGGRETLYRCGRCGRAVKEAIIEDHAWNAHVIDPANIDFEPIITGGEA